ncbi:Cathepsin L1 [Tritrichomonas foetus]|uniref:Cathepsin L1 n=1 Tax=Tritrichomonas foetus TaxID=1144522 RepID=A0A1J4KEE7_9EUKA|nr:Cathepsin L1 [Tritrichomonas foetus]|eukprot:OHT09378.1 Cathepsin L1 [Tritrichomonas foetus]
MILSFLFSLTFSSLQDSKIADDEKSFVNWMRNTQQIFTGDSYLFRMNNFVHNVNLMNQHNAKSPYKVGPNKYSHFSPAEIQALFSFKDYQPHPRTQSTFSDFQPPEELDWRENNTVTGIKNQGSCGSCWAFTSVAVIESLLARTTGKLVDLSPQSLVDCCTVCNGCLGCDPCNSLSWTISQHNGSIPLEQDYPYTGVQGSCQAEKFDKSYGNIKSWGFVDFCNETDLMVKCAEYGPVLVAMKANLWSFLYYDGGIFYEEGCSQFDYDHAMAVVGYGSENEKLFWIAKNSMGPQWGEAGYIRIARNSGNMCGIASRALYVSDEET